MPETEDPEQHLSAVNRELSRLRIQQRALVRELARLQPDSATHFIVGGGNTPAGMLDHCCAIGAAGTRCWRASGVLVHPRLVLTAAHVGQAGGHSDPDLAALRVTDVVSPPLEMKPTDPHLTTGPEVVAAQFRPNPKYLVDQTHDIGSLALKRPSGVTSIPALATDAEIAAATEVLIAGFGLDGTPGSDGILRDVWVDIQFMKGGAMGPAAGDASALQFDHDLEFVAGTAVKGACIGDSGGPVYIQPGTDLKLAGIVISGDGNCQGFTICTRIDVNRAWIECQIAAISH